MSIVMSIDNQVGFPSNHFGRGFLIQAFILLAKWLQKWNLHILIGLKRCLPENQQSESKVHMVCFLFQ